MNAITLLLSEISTKGPMSIYLLTAVTNLQLTVLSDNLQRVKSQRFCGSFTLTMARSGGDIIYMSYP